MEGSFHGAGDSVIVEGRYSGTYKPTGKSIDVQVCHVWDVKGGKVTRFQQYVDTAKLQAAMGVPHAGRHFAGGSRLRNPVAERFTD